MRAILLILCSTTLLGGCASMPSSENWKISKLFKKDDKPEPYPNPVRMAAMWTADTLSAPGKTTTRGFGGRLFFYNEKSQAVPVEGELQVVGYIEESDGLPPQTRRFAFTKEQFTSHYSQSDLGASYSIWVPWDAEGNPCQKVILVASFTTAEGKVVQGPPTLVALPGPSLEAFAASAKRRAGMTFSEMTQKYPLQHSPQAGAQVQQAGFEPSGTTPVDPSIYQPRPGITTTTIPMSGGSIRRMQ